MSDNEAPQAVEGVDFFVDLGNAKQSFLINRVFKVHLLLGVAITAASFLLWLLVALFKQHWPWFIYPATFFALSTTFHFYIFIRPKETLSLHFAWFFILNLTVFMSWLFSGSSRPWFLFVFFGWAIFLVSHYILISYRGVPQRNLYLHLSCFALINGLCFFIWLSFPTIAWFIWPFFGLGLLAAIHWSLYHHPGNYYRLHVITFIDVQLLLFFTWVITGMPFPWWIFPLVVWSALLVAHTYLIKGDTAPPQATVPLAGTYSPPPEEPFHSTTFLNQDQSDGTQQQQYRPNVEYQL